MLTRRKGVRRLRVSAEHIQTRRERLGAQTEEALTTPLHGGLAACERSQSRAEGQQHVVSHWAPLTTQFHDGSVGTSRATIYGAL